MNVVTDSEKIEEFLSRGVENIFPNTEFLKTRMLEGKQLSMYLGIDPTAPTLHLGHSIPVLKLSDWQKLGHRAILLIGDFTAMIGDPTDKLATRRKLSREEVLANASSYRKLLSGLLDFEGDNPVVLRYNSEWLGKMTFADVLELESNFTHAQVIKRDMFQTRIEEGKDLYMHELMYPMMQGYDSVMLGVDGEVGGNDQTFNMLAGRDLVKKLQNREKFTISVKLLADSAGKKMGKTEGNMAELGDLPGDMFAKVMTWGDDFIVSAFELCTRVGKKEIDEIRKKLESGEHPRDLKMRLAHAIVLVYHGKHLADMAEQEFVNVFQKGELPQDMPEYSVTKGTSLGDVLVPAHIPSKSEFKRLIDQGAMIFDGKKVELYHFVPETSGICKWSRHYVKVTVM